MGSKILILGNFASISNLPDGQSIKTRNIYDLLNLKADLPGAIEYFNTELLKFNKLSFMPMVWKIVRAKRLVYVPARSSLTFLFPIVYVISRIARFEILYFVVGGWLAGYLQLKTLHVAFLSKIRAIFTESEQLRQQLKDQYRLGNVVFFPNFRLHSFVPSFRQDQSSFKVVFMARITPMKGLDAVFRLAKYFEERYDGRHTMTIDFYGPIERPDVEISFRKQIESFPFIMYKGILKAHQVYGVLDQSDLVVLPTKYPTEGFPGTILDAYISGIPVVVSNWSYSSEFVEEGGTGFVFDLDNETKFYHDVERLYQNRHLLQTMKHNAYQKSKLYSAEKAWDIMKEYLSCSK